MSFNSITLRDIAQMMKVDTSTVSRALSNSQRVRPDLKARIQKKAHELKYIPNASALSLRTSINNSIALALPQLDFMGGDFYANVYHGLTEELNKEHFSLTVCDVYGDNASFDRTVRQRRVDGVIIFGDSFTDKDITHFNNINLPICMLHTSIKSNHKNIVNIKTDNYSSMYKLTEHLLQKHNCNDFLYFSGGTRYLSDRERLVSVKDCLAANNKKLTVMEGDFSDSLRCGYDLFKKAVKDKVIFDALISASDDFAIGVMSAAEEMGKKIPEDFRLTGFDNISFAPYLGTSLTSVDPGAGIIGRKGAESIINWIKNKKMPAKKNITVPARIYYRRSCGCVDTEEKV